MTKSKAVKRCKDAGFRVAATCLPGALRKPHYVMAERVRKDIAPPADAADWIGMWGATWPEALDNIIRACEAVAWAEKTQTD